MKRYSQLFVLLAALLVPAIAHAGANSGGRAWLSWDRAGLVSDLAVTSFGERDLFIQLEGAPDVRAVTVELAPSTEYEASAVEQPPSHLGKARSPRVLAQDADENLFRPSRARSDNRARCYHGILSALE